MIDTLKTSKSLPPILTTSPSVGPVPTVAPGGDIIFQDIHETGKRTLWYATVLGMRRDEQMLMKNRVVTVLMAISSLVFYVLSARAPVVSSIHTRRTTSNT